MTKQYNCTFNSHFQIL